MKFLIRLLSLARSSRTTATEHNDNLRAGKDAPTGLVHHGSLNGLML